jgi:hypothetical protein
MLAPKITNHVQHALAQLLQQYQGRPNITGLFTAIVQHVQKLENALYPLDQYRQLLSAYGQQLDNLGEVIGLQRNGLPDNQYLVLLLGTIAENNSDGTAPTLLTIIQLIFQSNQVFYKDPNSTTGPARPRNVAFGVGSPSYPASVQAQIEQMIAASVAGGIAISYISSFAATGCFAMAGLQAWTRNFGPPSTPTQSNPWPFCFGDLNNPYVGGGYASLLYSNETQ